MWLKALSKRTPRAYFTYFTVVLLLLIIPSLSDYFLFFKSLENNITQESFFTSYSIFIIPIASLILSLYLNHVFIISDTFKRNTLWPGYFFVLLITTIMNQFSIWQILTHGLIGILITQELLKVNYNRDARSQCFNIGLYISIASLLDNTLLIIVPLLLYGLINLKPLTFKEYLMYVLGLSTPIYFLFAFCFLKSDYTIWAKCLTFTHWFKIAQNLSFVYIFLWSIIIVIIVILLSMTFFNYNSLSVYIRRISSALLYLIGGIIVVGFANQFNGFIIFYLAPSIAFFSTMLMLRYTNNRLVPIIHFIFVALIIGLQLANNYIT